MIAGDQAERMVKLDAELARVTRERNAFKAENVRLSFEIERLRSERDQAQALAIHHARPIYSTPVAT